MTTRHNDGGDYVKYSWSELLMVAEEIANLGKDDNDDDDAEENN